MKAELASNMPFVSVIVPVRNGTETIASCIEGLLNLDYPADRRELIVVDNLSTDATADIVVRYPGVRLLFENERPSSYAARNCGVWASRGEVLAFTDADCVPERGWLHAMVRALEPANVGGVAGSIRAYTLDSAVERYQAAHALDAARAFAQPRLPFAQTANAAYKRAPFLRVGGFDPAIVFGGDLDLSWRLQVATGLSLVYEPCALVWHRHRTTTAGLYRLYRKNALANCLLARYHEDFASFPRLRTLLWAGREAAQSGTRAALSRVTGGDRDATAWFDAICYVGAASGWMRWHFRGLGTARQGTPASVSTMASR